MLDKRKLKSIDEILNKEVTNSKGETMKLSEIPRTAQPTNTKSSSIKKTTENKNKSNNNTEYKNYGIYAREGLTVPQNKVTINIAKPAIKSKGSSTDFNSDFNKILTSMPEMRNYTEEGPHNYTQGETLKNALKRADNAAFGALIDLGSNIGILEELARQKSEQTYYKEKANEYSQKQLSLINKINYLKNYQYKNNPDKLLEDEEYNTALKELRYMSRIANAYKNPPANTNTNAFKEYDKTHEFSQKAREGLDGAAKMAIDILYGGTQNAYLIPFQLIAPGTGLGLMSAQAAANKAYEVAKNDGSANEAIGRGIVSGSIEALTEKIGLDRVAEGVKLAKPAAKSFVRNEFENMAKQFSTEFLEEGASNILNYAADRLANDRNAKFSWKDLLYESTIGGLTGAATGGAVGVMQSINNSENGLSDIDNNSPDSIMENLSGNITSERVLNDLATIALQNQLNEQQVQQPQIEQEQQNIEAINNNQMQQTQPLETVNKNSVTNEINNQEEAVKTDSEEITGNYTFDTTRYGTAGKNEIVKNYDNNTSSEEYQEEFDRYYNMGLRGESTFEEMQNTKSPILNENQKTGAWISGVADVSSANSQRKDLTLPTAQEAEMLRSESPTQSFDMSNDEKTISRTVGDITGLKINLVKDLDYNANALYSQKRGEINISIKGDGFLPSLGHEVLHFVRDYNPEGYTELRDIVLKFAATSENKSLDRYIEDYRRTYEKAGDYTNEQLTEEITADAMQKALENDSFVDYISRREQSLGQKIIDFLKDVATSIKNAISSIKSGSYNQYSEISEDIEKNYSDVKGLYTKFYNAMEKAGYEFKKGYEPTDIFDESFITENKAVDNLTENNKSTTSQVNNKENAENEKDIKFFENEEDLEESLEDFSLPEEENKTEENKKLKEQNKNLKEQLELSKIIINDRKTIKEKAKNVLKKYNSKYNVDELANSFLKLADYIDESGNVDTNAVMNATEAMARKVLNESEFVDTSIYEEYKDLRNKLRKTRIKVNDNLKKEIENQYDNYNSFRRKNMGRLLFNTKEGIEIDSLYQELSNEYPEFFNANEEITEIAQLDRIIEVLDSLRPKVFNGSEYLFEGMNLNDAVRTAAQDIYLEMTDIPVVEEKIRNQILKLRNKYNKNIYDLRDYYKEYYKKEAENKLQENRTKRKESEERTKLLKLAQRIEKMKTTPENMQRVQELLKDIDLFAKSITDNKLNDLSEVSALLDRAEKENTDFTTPGKIRKQLLRLQNRKINDMEISEVESLIDNLAQLEYEIQTDKKLLGDQYKKDVYETAKGWIDEVNKSGGRSNSFIGKALNTYNIAQLKAENFFRLISGYADNSDVMKIYKGLENGEVEYMKFKQAADNKFSKYIENKKLMEKITGKNADEIDISQILGKEKGSIKITPAMRISLYLHSLNDANMAHIDGTWYLTENNEENSSFGGKRRFEKAPGGGVTIPDLKLYKQGKIEESYINGKRLNMSKSEINKIAEGMSEKEKQLAKDISSFLNNETKEAINKTSIILNGFEKARVNNYFPIRTNKNYTKTENEGLMFDATLEGSGMLKERTGAKNPLLLEDALLTLDRQVENTAKYSGFAVPVRNLNKVHNTTLTGYEGSVKDTIAKNWGKEAETYIENLIKDVQFGRERGERSFLDKVRGNYAQAVLTLNPGTVIKQLSGVTAAVNNIDPDVLAKAMLKVEKNLDAEIDEHTPIYWNRRQGNYIREEADTRINKGWEKRFNGKLKRSVFGWLDIADEMTIKKIWTAAKLQVEKNNRKNQLFEKKSDEYWQEVNDLFTKTVWETQPNYSPLQSGNIMKSTNEITKTFTMFGTQNNVNYNLLSDRLGELKARTREYRAALKGDDIKAINAAKKRLNESRKKTVRAVTSEIVQQGTFAALDIAVALLGLASREKLKDDEGNITEESLAKATAQSFLSAVSGTFYMGNEFFNVINSMVTGDTYYGIDNIKFETLSNIGSDVVALTNSIGTYKLLFDEDIRNLANLQKNGETGAYNELLEDLKEEGYEESTIKKAVNYYNNGGALKEVGENAFNLLSELAYFAGKPINNIKRLGQIPQRWVEMVDSKKTADIINSSNLSLTDKYKSIRNINDGTDESTKSIMLDLIVEAARNEDKEAYNYMYKDMITKDIVTETAIKKAIDNSYKDELKKLPEMRALVEAEKNGDSKAYIRNVNKIKDMGYPTKYIRSVLDTFTKAETEKTEQEIEESAEDLYNDSGQLYTYNIAFNAVNSGDMESYNEIKKEAVNSGMSEATFINNVLNAQNEYAEKTGGTVISTKELFNEMLNNGQSKKYKEIYEGLKKYGKTDENIENSISSYSSDIRKLYYEARYNGDYNNYEKYRKQLLNIGVTPESMNRGYKQYVNKLEDN